MKYSYSSFSFRLDFTYSCESREARHFTDSLEHELASPPVYTNFGSLTSERTHLVLHPEELVCSRNWNIREERCVVSAGT